MDFFSALKWIKDNKEELKAVFWRLNNKEFNPYNPYLRHDIKMRNEYFKVASIIVNNGIYAQLI